MLKILKVKRMERILRAFALRRKRRSLKEARDYIAGHDSLRDIIIYADSVSESVGVSLVDYVTLYRAVRTRKPKVVLECGTGKSTLIIAQAMLDNANTAPVAGTRLVSMEHNPKWYEHSLSAIPDKFRDFVEIHHSPVDMYAYSFVRGHVYNQVPDHPYEFAFIDGPPQALEGETTMCDMDFVRVVAGSDTPVSAFIDNRKHTTLAYSLIFGSEKVSYYPELSLGVVSDVTRQDMILGDKERMRRSVFASNVLPKKRGRPF